MLWLTTEILKKWIARALSIVIVFLVSDFTVKATLIISSSTNSEIAEEINLNAEYFYKYNPKNEIEQKLLNEARELRLCLRC